jgi:hypothetical protein
MKKMHNMIKLDNVQLKADAFAFDGSFAPAYNYEQPEQQSWGREPITQINNTFLIGRS